MRTPENDVQEISSNRRSGREMFRYIRVKVQRTTTAKGFVSIIIL
jgi:hypothetical protein